MIETIAELIEALGRFEPDTQVRIASFGHRTSLSYYVEETAVFTVEDEAIVYIAEGGQEGYLPSGVREEFGR